MSNSSNSERKFSTQVEDPNKVSKLQRLQPFLGT